MMDIGRNERGRRWGYEMSPRGGDGDEKIAAFGIMALGQTPQNKPKKALMIVMPTQPMWKVDPGSPTVDRGCGVTPTLYRHPRTVNHILVPNRPSPNHSEELISRIHSGSRSPSAHFPRNSVPRFCLSRGKKRPYGVNALTESLKDPLKDTSLRPSQSPSVCRRSAENRKGSSAPGSRLRLSHSRGFPMRLGRHN